MELKKFTIEDILKLDTTSKEVKNWSELCGLCNALNAATFEPVKESILEHFIRTYPPEKMIFDYSNTMSIISFGLLFFNKEQILDNKIDFDILKDKLILEKKFYFEILENYFGERFKQEGALEMDIDNLIKNIKGKNNNSWLRIRKEYERIRNN